MKKLFTLLAIITLVFFNANAAKDGITSFQKGETLNFTHHVGAKLEFAGDFNEGDIPWLSVGVTFKF